jgi:hypothetical protein
MTLGARELLGGHDWRTRDKTLQLQPLSDALSPSGSYRVRMNYEPRFPGRRKA